MIRFLKLHKKQNHFNLSLWPLTVQIRGQWCINQRN